MSTLDAPIWSRCNIAPTCIARSHFQRPESRENGAKVWMNVTARQEKENKETKRGNRRAGEKKSENRRPVLEKLCAALLRSFREQHSEKTKGSARVTGTLGKSNSHFDPTQTGSRTAPAR